MTIEQTVEIPADHRLTIEVPPEIPEGRAVLAFTPVSFPETENQQPRPEGRGMLFSCGGCTQGFNTFLTALKGGVLNPFGTNKGGKIRLTRPMIDELLRSEALHSPAVSDKPADAAGKQATPISDSLLGIAAGAGDISLDELRAERLIKYLK